MRILIRFLFCAVILNGNFARSIQNVTTDKNNFITFETLEMWKKNMTDMIKDLIEERTNDARKHVYFYAKMPAADITYNRNSVVKFSNVLNNEGNHFNSGDSIFISPVSGVYLFSWSTQSYSSKNVNTELRVDNVIKETLNANLDSSVGFVSVTQVVICKVKKNDHVWIQTGSYFGENVFEYEYGAQSSFMGVLLYQL